jgi:methylglutaconyl-CoA hydratase
MDFRLIRYAAGERVARITLNRPDKRNALDDTMIGELTTAFTAATRDSNVKVVVLAAAGPAFCAGADLEQLERMTAFDLEQNRTDSQRLSNLFRTMYEIRKPVIALVHGPAIAGGCGLATLCDFVLAARDRATFGYTEVHIGFVPALVAVYLAKRIGEGRARELILRGNILNATEAEAIGLITAAIPDDQLEKRGSALVKELIAKNSATAMGLAKETLGKMNGMNMTDALDFAVNVNAAARMTGDCKKGVQAFLHKQLPDW